MSQKQINAGGGENPVTEKTKAILGNQGASSAAQKAKDALAALDAAEAERLKKEQEAKKKKAAAQRRACCGCCGTF